MQFSLGICIMTKRTVLCLAGLLFAAPLLAAPATTALIDGRKVELVALKNPATTATVVFENGSRATVDKWDKVIDGIAPQASVFAYNRPGYGNSANTDAPRDGLTIVEELRRSDPQTIAFVRSLYPQAQTIVVDSDHQMQTASPQVIIDAIQQLIAAPRK